MDDGFTLDHVSIPPADTNRTTPMADCYVVVGAFRVQAQLWPDGSVTVDEALRDEALKIAIAAAFRSAVVAELTETFTLCDEQDRKSLEANERYRRRVT